MSVSCDFKLVFRFSKKPRSDAPKQVAEGPAPLAQTDSMYANTGTYNAVDPNQNGSSSDYENVPHTIRNSSDSSAQNDVSAVPILDYDHTLRAGSHSQADKENAPYDAAANALKSQLNQPAMGVPCPVYSDLAADSSPRPLQEPSQLPTSPESVRKMPGRPEIPEVLVGIHVKLVVKKWR